MSKTYEQCRVANWRLRRPKAGIRRYHWRGGAAVIGLLIWGGVGAQVATPAPAAPVAPAASATTTAGNDLQEITVTAQRRSESLERVPVTMEALGSADLVKQQIDSESNLQIAVPGLIVRAGRSSDVLNYSIRGETVDPISDMRPGVLPYVDEIQVGGSGGSSAIYDLKSIQVLKGPQGTLFGRNSPGGAVIITTNGPGNDISGYISTRLGTYNTRYFEGAIDLPIVPDKVLLRVAAISQDRDGIQTNEYNGQQLGVVDRKGVRGTLLVNITDQLKNETVLDYLHSGGSPVSGVLFALDPKGSLPSIALTNAATMDQTISAIAGVPGLGNGAAAEYFAAHPNLPKGGLAEFLATQQSLGPYRPNVDSETRYRAQNIIVSNITTYRIDSDLTIKNIFGRVKLISRLFSDIDGSPFGIDGEDPLGKIDFTDQTSDEVQLQGSAFNSKLTYTAGYFYSDESTQDLTSSTLLNFPILSGVQINARTITNQTDAIYGQGTYALDEVTGINGLSVTAGARLAREKVGIQILPNDISFSDPAAVQATYEPSQSKTFENGSTTFSVQEQLNQNVMVYLATRSAPRNGGYNGFVKPKPGLSSFGGNGYSTERVTDVETGVKFQGDIVGVPTRLNLAVYNMWISNGQRGVFAEVGGAPAALTVNVPKGLVTGFEFDGQVNPTSWLSLGAAASYTDARYTDNLVSILGATPVHFGTYPDTPKWTGSVFGEATYPIRDSLALSFRTDIYGETSDWDSGTGNLDPGAKLPEYVLTNFRLALENKAVGWTLSANLKNVFNRTYYIGGEPLGTLFQVDTATPGEPRMVTVEARYNF
jgi:iron complex outermembrane recepter protein